MGSVRVSAGTGVVLDSQRSEAEKQYWIEVNANKGDGNARQGLRLWPNQLQKTGEVSCVLALRTSPPQAEVVCEAGGGLAFDVTPIQPK